MANLSKIKIGGTVYNLKDAEARGKLVTLLGGEAAYAALNKALGDAAWLGADSEISETTAAGTGVATTKATKAYVDAQIGTINKFDVVVDKDGTSTGPSATASADTMYKLYMVPDTTAAAGTYIEWITIRSGSEGSYTYTWEKIGSTKADLTGYVPVERKIAGIDLQDDITVAELEASTALNLKNFAHADQGTGEFASQTISGVKATGTPEGTVEVTLTDTSTAASLTTANYTPAGTITSDAIKGGSINVTLKDGDSADATLTRADYTPAGTVALTADNAGSFQVGGTNAESDVTITPSTDTAIKSLKDGTVDCATFTEGTFTPASLATGFYTAGTAATFTEGAFTPASLGEASTNNFNTDGIKGHMATGDEITGDVDAETLIFEDAATSAAVTGYASFNGGSKAADSFTANTPATIDTTKFSGGSKAADTFTSSKVQVPNETVDAWTGVTSARAAAQTFTGNKYAPAFTGTAEKDLKVTKASYTKQAIDEKTFTGEAATETFAGTEVANALVTGVNYEKQTVNTATFTGKAATFDVGDISVAAQTITVTPKTGD